MKILVEGEKYKLEQVKKTRNNKENTLDSNKYIKT